MLTSQSLGIFGGVDDLDTAIESGLAVLSEISLENPRTCPLRSLFYLSSSSSKNLGLDNAVRSRQVLGDFVGLFWGSGHVSFWSLDAILLQQIEGEILMD